MHVRARVCVSMCMCAHAFSYLCMCVHVCVHVCVCACVSMRVRVYVCACVHQCDHVCISVTTANIEYEVYHIQQNIRGENIGSFRGFSALLQKFSGVCFAH